MLPQHWAYPDYCYLESVIGVKPRQLHQMADSTNPSLGGCVIQWYYLLGLFQKLLGISGLQPLSLLPSLSTIVGISIKTIGLEFSQSFKFTKVL